MKILIIGIKKKLMPVYIYCKENGYDVMCIRAGKGINDSEILNNAAVFINDVDDSLFHSFCPDQIINFKEQKKYLQLELHFSDKLKLETFLTKPLMEFFSCKYEQDNVFKYLDIPTVPNISDNVIVKSQESGGTDFKVMDRKLAELQDNYFQDYLDIDYIISCHFYSDGKKWYHLNNHMIKYIDNCPLQSITPYLLNGKDKEIIEDSIEKLSKEILIKNKLFGWQFMKDKDGNLYSIDFNLRPFGGFDMGSYDTDVSDQNWISYLFDNKPPMHITYTHTIECFYKNKQKFGYSTLDRIKTKLIDNIKFEVKIYD